jgi:hypothetical protein
MATLIVGGVTVPVAAGGRTIREERSDRRRDRSDVRRHRSIDGARLQAHVDFTTRMMLAADAATLKAALLTTALPVACSGDITGAVNCIPRLVDYTPVRAHSALRRRVVFTLTEV